MIVSPVTADTVVGESILYGFHVNVPLNGLAVLVSRRYLSITISYVLRFFCLLWPGIKK
jgi:hypothetical protein